eukprot:364347-Chlamydomonas_euryale.AAC.6
MPVGPSATVMSAPYFRLCYGGACVWQGRTGVSQGHRCGWGRGGVGVGRGEVATVRHGVRAAARVLVPT